jgi:hypothetical protein
VVSAWQTLSQMQLFREAEEAIRFSIKCGDLSKTIYSSAAAALSQIVVAVAISMKHFAGGCSSGKITKSDLRYYLKSVCST